MQVTFNAWTAETLHANAPGAWILLLLTDLHEDDVAMLRLQHQPVVVHAFAVRDAAAVLRLLRRDVLRAGKSRVFQQPCPQQLALHPGAAHMLNRHIFAPPATHRGRPRVSSGR